MLLKKLAQPLGLSLIYMSLLAVVGAGLSSPKGKHAPSQYAYIRHF